MRSRWTRLALAAALTLASVGILWLVHDVTLATVVVQELLIPITLAAYVWGRSPGIAATAVATCGAALLVSRDGLDAANVQRIALLAVEGVLVSVLLGWLHEARARAEQGELAQRAANDALLRSELRFATAFDASPLPSAVVRTSDRRLIAVNDACVRWLDRRRAEVLGLRLDDFGIPPGELRALIARLALDGFVRGAKVHATTALGMRTVLASCERMDLDRERHTMIVFEDVTEREHAERARHESEDRFAAAFNACPLPYAMMRFRDRVLVAANDAFLRFYGYTRDEVVGHREDELGCYADPIERDAARELVARDGRVRELELGVRRRSGEVRRISASIETVMLDGEAYGVGVFVDITDQRRAARELQASEERFARAFDGTPLPLAIARCSDHALLAVNDAFLGLAGFTREALLGRTLADVGFHVDPGLATDLKARCLEEGNVRDAEVQVRRDDGTIRDALFSAEVIEIAGEPFFFGSWQDVTERNRHEAALRESEERFRQLAENIREVFWLYDQRDRRVLYVSPAYETMWQRSRARLLDDPNDWMLAVHPEDREHVRATWKRDDGDQQYRIVLPDGSVRWIRDRAFPVRDEHGKVVRVAGLAEDVTERRALEDQLRQAQKMESLGMLAGGVAHDFNNLLAVIASSNGMLADMLPREGEAREIVDEVDAAVNRATGLTRQLLAFSRKQVIEPKVVDLNAAVTDTRKMLRRMVGEDVLLHTSLDPELSAIRVDPGYLVQVLMNLAVNARDAMPRGGTLDIATRNLVIDEALARAHLGAKPGPAVVLSVTDSGTGMSAEVLAHIFEPFFTTKEQGKGTGMGLAVVHGIVEQAGGFITVDSTVGAGSTFRVYFPASTERADAAHESSAAACRGLETILFVDDDEYVRRSAARALRARGYHVVEAADATAALGQVQPGIDLLVTDVVMPKMDGRQLADAARARMPELKILFTTGYTDDAVVRHGVLQGEFELLEKPFRAGTLAARIRQVLDR